MTMDVRKRLQLVWGYGYQAVGLRFIFLFCLSALLMMPVEKAEALVYAKISSEHLDQFFNEVRWSIMRNHLSEKVFQDDLDRFLKPVQSFSSPVRLSHRTINKQQHYEKSVFDSDVHFLQSHFLISPEWTMVAFNGESNFSSTLFDQPAAFKWVVFNKLAFFPYAQFFQQASFYGSFFKNRADFYRAEFDKFVNFSAVRFSGAVNFSDVHFDGKANFKAAEFQSKADFNAAQFDGDADFSNTHFRHSVDWREATFGPLLSLSGAEFGDVVLFNHAIMPDVLDLSYVTNIKKIIDLTNVRKPKGKDKCLLNLVGADISKIKFRYQPFALYFPEDTSDSDIQYVYESVLSMFAQQGFSEGHQAIMIEYKQYQYKKSGQWLMNAVQQYGWNYGFDPERIFYWIGAVILFFTSINALFYRHLVEKVMDVPFLARHAESDFVEKNPVLRYIYYFPMTIVFTILILFSQLLGFKRNFTDLRNANLWVNVYIVTLISVGVICSLFVLNYVLGGR